MACEWVRADGLGADGSWDVSRLIEFGVILGLGKASWMWDRAVRAAALIGCGCVVLWQCESGSGASLGACDSGIGLRIDRRVPLFSRLV
jgi:hypothetical protein